MHFFFNLLFVNDCYSPLLQETFGKRVASMLTTELKKECSKYEEAHRKAIESNNTLETAVNIHISNLAKLFLPLEELAKILPSSNLIKSKLLFYIYIMSDIAICLDFVQDSFCLFFFGHLK